MYVLWAIWFFTLIMPPLKIGNACECTSMLLTAANTICGCGGSIWLGWYFKKCSWIFRVVRDDVCHRAVNVQALPCKMPHTQGKKNPYSWTAWCTAQFQSQFLLISHHCKKISVVHVLKSISDSLVHCAACINLLDIAGGMCISIR